MTTMIDALLSNQDTLAHGLIGAMIGAALYHRSLPVLMALACFLLLVQIHFGG